MGSVIYAHQGGWDEILLVAVPIAAIVLLLRVAERRADHNRRMQEADDTVEPAEGQGAKADIPERDSEPNRAPNPAPEPDR